jgi:SAM-dependent methyltransferase
MSIQPPRDFYETVLADATTNHGVSLAGDVLVVCGGRRDADALRTVGFTNALITNLDAGQADGLAPYVWQHEDAERLTFPDASFDVVIAHSGLHHCRAPGRALAEMLRVSRSATLMFEPYDNLLTRVGLRLGLGQRYEHASVYESQLQAGGVANDPLPNFVYRFSRREITKTARAFYTHGDPRIYFYHQFDLPTRQLELRRRRLPLMFARLIEDPLRAVARVAPQAANRIAALVLAPTAAQRHAWLESSDEGLRPRNTWFETRFRRPPR